MFDPCKLAAMALNMSKNRKRDVDSSVKKSMTATAAPPSKEELIKAELMKGFSKKKDKPSIDDIEARLAKRKEERAKDGFKTNPLMLELKKNAPAIQQKQETKSSVDIDRIANERRAQRLMEIEASDQSLTRLLKKSSILERVKKAHQPDPESDEEEDIVEDDEWENTKDTQDGKGFRSLFIDHRELAKRRIKGYIGGRLVYNRKIDKSTIDLLKGIRRKAYSKRVLKVLRDLNSMSPMI